MTAAGSVSAGIVRGLLAFARERGANASELARVAGVDPGALDDADGRVPFEAFIRLNRAAQAALSDPAFSLRFAEQVDMSEISILGLIMNASATMGEAFQQLQRFGRLAQELDTGAGGPGYELVSRRDGLWMVARHDPPPGFHEHFEMAFARLVCGPRRFLPKPHILEAHFTHAAPSYRAEYERVFQCPLTFSAPWNAMRVPPDLPAWPVAQHPRYVFGVLAERAGALMESIEAERTLRGRVERLLLPVLHTGEASAERVAAELGFSRQTLFRRLRAENTTFAAVLEGLRKRMALHYLAGRQATVNETAYLVGFSDPAAFSRAFKRWTGRNPRDVRRDQ